MIFYYPIFMPQVICKECDKEFYAKPSWIKNGGGKYCSQACFHVTQKSGSIFACDTCGKATYKSGKDQRRSKSGKYFCNKACQTKWRNVFFSGPNHSNWKSGIHSYRDILRRNGNERRCGKCQTDDIRILAVHHKDRNRQNNSVSNLVWLCHNCHHLVHHHKAESVGFLTG